jgi:uncharacterized protein (DUF58 family)
VAINFAKLNHVLIPPTKPGRDRFREGPGGKLARPVVFLYEALSAEGRVVALLSLVVGALGLDVVNTQIYVLWAALAGLLGASLLVRPRYALGGVRATVVAPLRVTVGEPIAFTVALVNAGARDHHAVRVRGPFLPWDGRFLDEPPRVTRLAAGQTARVSMRARFVERGEHHLDPFAAAAVVPLGLAMGASIDSPGCRFVVVPRVARVVRLTLPTGRRQQAGGVPLASRTGESMELLGVRPYRAGDPAKDLHARSWARRGAPVVREYQEEHFRRVAVVVDVASRDERRVEAALSLAAGVVAHLGGGDALVELVVIGARADHEATKERAGRDPSPPARALTLGRSLGFLEQALDTLACITTDTRAGRGLEEAAGEDAAMARLAPVLSGLSSVVVVTAAGHDARALAARLAIERVACVALRVALAHDAAGASPGGFTVTAAAIERGEALAL